MKSKKLIAIIAGAALMMPLAACGNKAVATTSGGKITESEYYSSMKQTSAGKQVLQQMILDKVLEKQYGKEVIEATNSVKLTLDCRCSSLLPHHY